ncbi:MAG: L,D-transpeptidase family protein [Hyphomicrobiaceae bacterium]
MSALTQAQAQERTWLDEIFNPTSTNPRFTGPPRRTRKKAPLEDLRHGPVPLRSDEMLAQLDEAIVHYQRLVAKGGWPTTTSLRLMMPGDDYKDIPKIRRQLILSGDIPRKGAEYYDGSYHFDDWLSYGVKRFQKRHGLRISGIMDRSTRAQLTVTAEARLGQLLLNRRRIAQLLQEATRGRYVLVNVPAFQLEAVDRYEVERRHRVVVGKPDRQTPEIKATIRGLNFFPYWRVPDSVARLDLIPRLIREPDYLAKEHIRAAKGYYDGPELDTRSMDWRSVDPKTIKFRQDPGPWNALGLVRINMPNKDIVYLHDTPLKRIFALRNRAFSAGCVRVMDVMELVSWIARFEPGLSDGGAVRHIIDNGDVSALRHKRPNEYDVKLTRPIPVHFVYITAWAEEDGTVMFRPDLYGRDGATELSNYEDSEEGAPQRTLSP